MTRHTRYLSGRGSQSPPGSSMGSPVPSTSHDIPELRPTSPSASSTASSSSHLSALRYLRGGGGKATPSPSPTPPQPPPEQEIDEGEASDLTWSPLPKRTERKVTEKLCVALLCGGREGVEGAEGGREGLDHPPAPSQPVTPSRPGPGKSRRWPYRQLALTGPPSPTPSLSPPLSPTPHHLRPCTNPRDTPTHHPNHAHAPLPPAPARDLTLDSLHDLEWLSEMEPGEQVILEVHVIWSILSLMVVLLACYSLHHHPPLTG